MTYLITYLILRQHIYATVESGSHFNIETIFPCVGFLFRSRETVLTLDGIWCTIEIA